MIFWIGYSWKINPEKSQICISIDPAIDNNSCKNKVTTTSKILLNWKTYIKPYCFANPGSIESFGISRGIKNTKYQTLLKESDNGWLNQLDLMDENFERNLADLLILVINKICENLKSNIPTTNEKSYIVIQGPSFPKLIGRIGYQNLFGIGDLFDIFFLTFRLRYLVPHPLLYKTEQNGLVGPFPTFDEESLIRKYYVLPKLPDIVKSKQANTIHLFPLLIEQFEYETQPQTYENMIEFLKLLSLKINSTNGLCEIDNIQKWSFYQKNTSQHQVLVPTELLEVNKSSQVKIQTNNKIIMQKKQKTKKANKL